MPIGTDIDHAANLLRGGDVIAIPTETVYGLAADALNIEAIERVYQIKGRPKKNPLILHLAKESDAEKWVASIPEFAQKLMDLFWPGPLTLVLLKKDIVHDIITARGPSVALRVPAHPQTRALLTKLDAPLVAPSANPSNYISPTQAEHVESQLGEQIPYILDGGPCDQGLESTIIDASGDAPVLLRQGAIAQEEIEAVVGPMQSRSQAKRPTAPGMMSRHYSPTHPLRLVEDLDAEIKKSKYHGRRVGVLGRLHTNISDVEVVQETWDEHIGLRAAAQGLYAALHRLDAADIDVILVRRFPEEGLGRALNDRLRRASATE